MKAKPGLKSSFEELEKLTPLLKDAVAEERKGAVELALAERDEQAATTATAPTQSEQEPLLQSDGPEAEATTPSGQEGLSKDQLHRLLQLLYFAQVSCKAKGIAACSVECHM